MIVLACEQRTDEWYRARLGIPTASEFDKILTPTGKVSTQAAAYRYRLLAEWLTGKPQESYQNGWMERGTEIEPEARDYYELTTDRTIEQVGFVFKDESRLVGCSPDGLFENSGLEIKVPSPGTHVHYLLTNNIPSQYIPQVQGAMWITGAKSWDWLSYHPDMPPVLITVRRDQRYIDLLDLAISGFISDLLRERDELLRRGLVPMTTKEALEASLELLNGRPITAS